MSAHPSSLKEPLLALNPQDSSSDVPLEDEEELSLSSRPSKSSSILKSTKIHSLLTHLVWNALFAGVAASIVFWIPNIYWNRVNMTYMLLNSIGSMIAAIVTQFENIKSQYPQTYLMYDGIKGGFCSVFTTFG